MADATGVHAAKSLGLEQRKWRPVREHQSSHRRATHEKDLPVGRHPLQLYSLGTPNGVKVTVLLEELLALAILVPEYDAWLIKIGDGDQFGSGFVSINPNSKIRPCWIGAAQNPFACSNLARS